jgi:hypothetical protein
MEGLMVGGTAGDLVDGGVDEAQVPARLLIGQGDQPRPERSPRDLSAPVRAADDRRWDAPCRTGQPAGPRDRAHQRGSAGHVELAVRDTGATSYLLKTAPAEDVIAAVRDAATGTASLSPELLTRLTRVLRRPPPPDPLQPLSPRERDVLRLIARGHSNRQIARDRDRRANG